MKAYVYIDGFNLYYCAVKGTSFKWLDLNKLCVNLFPKKQIEKIYYFTAKVRPSLHDPSIHARQDTYWRALRTITHLEIIEGHFVQWPRLMPQYPLAYINYNMNYPPQRVQVQRSEEKGSDVNLAAQLVYDSYSNVADEFIVISNDSDLALAIELVTRKIQKSVIVVNPNRTSRTRRIPGSKISADLKRVATRYLVSINDPVLAKSQFPTIFTDSFGTITKPTSW